MKRIALIGSGDLAHQIAHQFVSVGQADILGYYDDFTPKGTIINNYPIIGQLDDIVKHYNEGKFDELVVAVGYTRLQYRKDVFERFEHKIPFATFIHPRCHIDKTAVIGEGTIMLADCIVGQNAVVGNNINFYERVTIEHDVVIESHSCFAFHVAVGGFSTVGQMCNIGIGTVISDRVSICSKVRTGAGAVVVKDITESGTYVGVPVRKIKDTM